MVKTLEKASRDGHRKRIRENYRSNGINGMADHNIVELLVSFSVTRKDVKETAYNLINHFGSLENIMQASPEELMAVKGVGEITATLIPLVQDINRRIDENKNNNTKILSSTEITKTYFTNLLSSETKENVLLTTLDNSNRIIATHKIGNGSVNSSMISNREILAALLRDNATSAIVAHNHPAGAPTPSAMDTNFTVELLNVLRRIDVSLLDHIIVGENETLSMKSVAKYSLYFDAPDYKKKV